MKTKAYKLGSFVEHTTAGGSDTGTVTAVIYRNDGIYYELGNREGDVTHENILNEYRKVAPRKTSAPRARKKGQPKEIKAAA